MKDNMSNLARIQPTPADDDSLLLRLVSAPTPPVPEPSTAMLSLAGLLVLGLARAALRRG